MKFQKSILLAAVIAANLSVNSRAEAVLEEIIITAQKREQSMQDVPLSVVAISGEDLERGNTNDLVSLTARTPSLNYLDGFSPGSTNFNIRGIGSYTFEGGIQPSVSLVVDGVTYARAGEYIQELSDVERIEVLRGPQGTLFGRNSTGGAINITTRRPSEQLEVRIAVSLTDEQEQLYQARVSGPLAASVRGSLNGFYRDRDGHIDNIYPGVGDGGGVESWGTRGQLDIDFSDAVKLRVIGDYREAEFGQPIVITVPEPFLDAQAPDGGNLRLFAMGGGDSALGAEIANDVFKVNTNDPHTSDSEMENWGFSADLTWQIDNSLRLKSISAYRDWHEAVQPDIDAGAGQVANGGYGLPYHVTRTNLSNSPDNLYRHYDNNFLSQEFRLEGTGESLDWIVGVYYQDFEEEVNASVELFVDFVPAFGEGTLLSENLLNSDALKAYALFGDLTYHLTATIDIFGGYRWSREEVDIDFNNQQKTILESSGLITKHPETNTMTVAEPMEGQPGVIAQGAVGPADDDNDDWSGRLGFSWVARQDINLYGSVSRGFVGTAADISRAGTPENAFLEPTTTEAVEFGIKSMLLDRRLQLNAAVFVQNVEDMQTSAILPGTIQTVNLNAGDIDIWGVEADLMWAATDMIRVSTGVVYLDAEVDNLIQPCYPGQDISTGCYLDINGQPTTDPGAATSTAADGAPPNTPEWKYNINVDFEIPLNGRPFNAFASVGYAWQDDVTFVFNNDPLLEQDSYGLLDAALGIVENDGRYELSIFGKNLTDEEFVNSANETSGSFGRKWVTVTRGAQAYYGVKFVCRW